MPNRLNRLKEIMMQKYGRDISVYDSLYLLKSAEKRQASAGLKNIAEYCNIIEENVAEAEIFYLSLNITYSRFFRDTLNFALLETFIIPMLVSQKPEGSEIRVWSAGCSSGQEAYSIAMLLSEYAARGDKKIRYRIIATDISQPSLSLAKDGIYDWDAMQNIKMAQVNNFFINNGNKYTVVPKLKENITFSYYDLLDPFSSNPSESIYGDFDIIYCSNLLFYYQPDIQQTILKKLIKSLSSDGFLISGDAERTIIEKAANLRRITPVASVFRYI